MSAINRLIEKPAKWLSASGEEQEMVLSSRIRLARNLDSRPFTNNASPDELKEVKEEVEKAAQDQPGRGRGAQARMHGQGPGRAPVQADPADAERPGRPGAADDRLLQIPDSQCPNRAGTPEGSP